MRSGYESIIWIKDMSGKEYACYIDDIKDNTDVMEALSDKQRSRCLDVNDLVGTERW